MQKNSKPKKRVSWNDDMNQVYDIPPRPNRQVSDSPTTNIPSTIPKATVYNANDQETSKMSKTSRKSQNSDPRSDSGKKRKFLEMEHDGNGFSQNFQVHNRSVRMENNRSEHVQRDLPEQFYETSKKASGPKYSVSQSSMATSMFDSTTLLNQISQPTLYQLLSGLRKTRPDSYSTENTAEQMERDSTQHSTSDYDYTDSSSMDVFGDHSSPQSKRLAVPLKVQPLSTAQRKKQEAMAQAYAEIDERFRKQKQKMASAESREDTETSYDALDHQYVDLTYEPEIEPDLGTNALNDYTSQPNVALVESLKSRIKELEDANQQMKNNEQQMAQENNKWIEKCKGYEEVCRKLTEQINSITAAQVKKETTAKLMHENELEILRKQLQTECENSQKLKNELMRLERSKSEAEMTKLQVEQKYTQLSDRFNRCGKDISRYRKERNDAQSELEREKKKRESTVRNLRAEISELEKQLNCKEANLSTERQTNGNVKQEMAEMDRLQLAKRDNTLTNHQARELITLDNDEEYQLLTQFDSQRGFLSNFGQELMSSTSQAKDSEAEGSSFQALDFQSNQDSKLHVDRSNVSGSNQSELTGQGPFLTYSELQQMEKRKSSGKSSDRDQKSKSRSYSSSTKHPKL